MSSCFLGSCHLYVLLQSRASLSRRVELKAEIRPWSMRILIRTEFESLVMVVNRDESRRHVRHNLARKP